MKAMIKGWALVSVLTMLLSLAGVAYGEELPVIDDDDTTYWLDEVEGTAVSYTHLDVYKRQSRNWTPPP